MSSHRHAQALAEYEGRLRQLRVWPDKRLIFDVTDICARSGHLADHLADILISRLIDVTHHDCYAVCYVLCAVCCAMPALTACSDRPRRAMSDQIH
jgi:hypothetical protein